MIGDHEQASISAFERLPREIAASFREAQTCQLADALNGEGALDARIKPLVAGASRLAGSALTVACHPGDMFGVLAALPHVRPGDVLIVAAGGEQQVAVMGDLIALALKGKGAAGFVTDGYVRDIAGLRDCGLPVFAGGLTPRSGTKTGPCRIGRPIVCGGIAVRSGDLVVADEDGVVVVPRADCNSALSKLAGIVGTEQQAARALAADPGFFDGFARGTKARGYNR